MSTFSGRVTITVIYFQLQTVYVEYNSSRLAGRFENDTLVDVMTTWSFLMDTMISGANLDMVFCSLWCIWKSIFLWRTCCWVIAHVRIIWHYLLRVYIVTLILSTVVCYTWHLSRSDTQESAIETENITFLDLPLSIYSSIGKHPRTIFLTIIIYLSVSERYISKFSWHNPVFSGMRILEL